MRQRGEAHLCCAISRGDTAAIASVLRYLPSWGCGRRRNIVLDIGCCIKPDMGQNLGLSKYQLCQVALCGRDFVLHAI